VKWNFIGVAKLRGGKVR